MTALAIILAFVALALLAIVLWMHARMEVWISTRTRVFQLALAYVAAGRSSPNDQLFANAILTGNQATLTRRFPDYAEFYAQEAEKLEQDDG